MFIMRVNYLLKLFSQPNPNPNPNPTPKLQLIYYARTPNTKLPLPNLNSTEAYATANLLLALNLAPKIHRTNIPMIPITLNPPSNETPFPTPRLMNRGLPNKILPQAKADLKKSFPANSDAAY
jgi:hypothetical protein